MDYCVNIFASLSSFFYYKYSKWSKANSLKKEKAMHVLLLTLAQTKFCKFSQLC